MTERDYDVVIIGAGIAGLNAALAAHEAGLSAIVLEKSDQAGGATSWSYGATWTPCSAHAKAAGIADSFEAAEEYVMFLSTGEADPERARLMVRESPRVLAAMEHAGVKFELIAGVNDILWGKAPGASREGRLLEPQAIPGARLGEDRARLRTPPDEIWRLPRSIVVHLDGPAAIAKAEADALANDQLAQGPALVAGLMIALRQRGIAIAYETGVDALIKENGRVAGARSANGDYRARRGVIVATGAYLANTRLVKTLDQLTDYRSYFPPTAMGDGLVLAAEAGGSIRPTRNNVCIMLGFANPDVGIDRTAGEPAARELPRAHTMVVNQRGERFGNEVTFQELTPGLRAIDWKTRTPKNWPCWMVFDHRYVAQWGLAGSPAGTVPGFVISAPTVGELAEKAGIDPAGLEATVERFNGFAETGVDLDFDRKPGWALVPGAGGGRNSSLGAIAQAPFYAARLKASLGGGGSGVSANAAAQVIDWRDQPIPGLYCIGDAAHRTEYGAGYQAGMTYAGAMVFAWLAVEHMANARAALAA